MKTITIFFIGMMSLLPCWAMEGSRAKELEALYKKQGKDSFIPKLLAHIIKEKQRLEVTFQKPQRICEQQITGDDWVSVRNYNVALTADVPCIIPWSKWELYNCQIKVGCCTAVRLELTIIPDLFPILGEAVVPNATWKAVLWLEPKEGHLEPEDIEKNKTAIEQLELCQRNIQREYEALLSGDAAKGSEH